MNTRLPNPTEQANLYGVAITIGIIVILSFFIDIESLKVWVSTAGAWGPVIFILLKISTIIIAPLSGSPLYPLVGLLFGFWPGILYVAIGDFLGYSMAFGISRFFGTSVVSKFINQKEEGLLPKIIAHLGTPKGFLQACLTFFVVPELLSYAAGLSKLPYKLFIITLLPISLAVTSVLVLFGSVLDFSSKSLLVSLGLPVLGIIIMIGGGSFFVRSVQKLKK